MIMGFLQDFSLRIIVKSECSPNLPMPIVWLPLEVLKASTGFHSFQTSENMFSDGFKLSLKLLVFDFNWFKIIDNSLNE